MLSCNSCTLLHWTPEYWKSVNGRFENLVSYILTSFFFHTGNNKYNYGVQLYLLTRFNTTTSLLSSSLPNQALAISFHPTLRPQPRLIIQSVLLFRRQSVLDLAPEAPLPRAPGLPHPTARYHLLLQSATISSIISINIIDRVLEESETDLDPRQLRHRRRQTRRV